MTTLKDKGSEYYKQKKYEMAIKCYQQYLQDQHQDNDKAFFNNGLCYSFLKQHQKAIEYYQLCIQRNPQYSKAYYKIIKQFQQIDHGNQYYNIFITAHEFLKHSDKQIFCQERQQAQKIMNKHKKTLQQKVSMISQPVTENELFQHLQKQMPKMQQSQTFNLQIDKYADQWINQWKQPIQSDDGKWQEIKYIIQGDYNHGINLAHFYINQTMSCNLVQGKKISEQLKKIKKQRNIKPIITQDSDNNTIDNNHRQETQEQIKDLQDKLDNFHFDRINKKDQTLGGRLKSKKLEYFSALPKVTQSKEEEQKNRKQLESKMNISKTVLEQIKQNSIIVPEDADIETIYMAYCKKLSTTKDLFGQTYKSIINILNGAQTAETKGNLLILIKKRLKKFKMIIQSFTALQQANIYHLLIKSQIEEYANDFAPSFNKQ